MNGPATRRPAPREYKGERGYESARRVVVVCSSSAPAAAAADVEAGKARAAAVCAACHGVNGVSVADAIPNLAGRSPRISKRSSARSRTGSRKNPVMNAVARQLSPDDIANVAAYFATQTGATSTAKSDFLPNLAKTSVKFPEGYQTTFRKYHTINFPATKQVRYYFANDTALRRREGRQDDCPTARCCSRRSTRPRTEPDGKPFTGADGFFVADQLLFYTAMAREAGWGKDIPDMLRNEDWNYAAFATTQAAAPGQSGRMPGLPQAARQGELHVHARPADGGSKTLEGGIGAW
jgi:cytochrome c553